MIFLVSLIDLSSLYEYTQLAYIKICHLKYISFYTQTRRYYYDNSIMCTNGGKYKSLPY